jgi:hypothetical protein
MIENIKVIKNFVTNEEKKRLINFIDNNLDRFGDYSGQQNERRFALRFGKDQVYWDTSETIINGVEEIADIVNKYFDLVPQTVRAEFSDANEISLCSFWLAKQEPGAFVRAHRDANEKLNNHFKYSIIIYLNDNNGNSELSFPLLDYKVFPESGDMVVFPTLGHEYLHEVAKISQDRYSMLFWITEEKKLFLKKPQLPS